MKRCLANHQRCKANRQFENFPTRLLHLSSSAIRMIETASERPKEPYAALSHCWGQHPNQLRLTVDTYDTFRHGIELAALPKTFGDAVEVARSLGINYLWIDSLCIIQSGDQNADWTREIRSMASVYSNCHVNIAASCAANTQSGFFRTRDYNAIGPCTISLASSPKGNERLAMGDTLPVQDYAILPSPGRLETLMRRHPLGMRAWVLQERLLSPRTLHFSDQQLYWECNDTFLASESVPGGLPSSWGWQISMPVFSLRGKDEYDLRITWLDVLFDYTRRALTISMDKFPAIGAIAEVVQTHTGDKYLAGFFLAQLPRALLWFCTGDRSPPFTEKLGKRHAEGPYRAPTWSWACIDGPVSFARCYPDKATHSNVAPRNKFTGGGDFSSLIDWKMALVDSQNPFGQVKDAYIVLRGPLIEVEEVGESPRGKTYFKSSGLLSHEDPWLYFDVKFEPAQMKPAFLLPILWRAWGYMSGTQKMSQDVEYGLVLVRSSAYDDGSYERIGMFEGTLDAKTPYVYQGDQEVRIR
ncbi:HET domain containing protein [Hyaloscypha variabilis]|uniref:HET-domain-containing protein n=1 Tax=Hyaloscypha variabilis (strain UAMH 11265 / GT02V1 / F) TaxID=1149755 RepID=A0A2J6QU08_HYAVF|nr:HET-domain-containing protein [Hyaloscypha variabilis F]